MKITRKQLAERIKAPTTPFWESVSRKCKRLALTCAGAGAMIITGLKTSLGLDITIPYAGVMSIVAGYIAAVGIAAGVAGYIISNLTVADPEELKHS